MTTMRQDDSMMTPYTANGRYEHLTTGRDHYLRRAWDAAELTLPSLLVRNGRRQGNQLPIPWQSLGAKGVNHLAAKLLLVLFPPNTSMFRLRLDEILIKKEEAKLGTQQTKNITTDLEEALGIIERAVMADVEMSGDRVQAFEALKHLLVTGNVLLHMRDRDGMRVYHLDHFVVKRDPSGNPLEIIAHEVVDRRVLPREIQSAIQNHHEYNNQPEKAVELFTHIQRTETVWTVHQEVCGKRVAGTTGTYPLDKLPWLPLRLVRIDGEDYGDGFVEALMGDLRSLDTLREAIVTGSAAAAKIVFLIKPNTTTRARVLADAPNGAFVQGNADDVSVLRLDKAQDFATAKSLASELEQSLSYSFLLNAAIQRDAERVTAEEIRYMAQELESALGGLYSILSQEWQLPYIRVKMATMQKHGRLPALPKGVVRPTIITGVEALGRGNDRNKLISFMKTLHDTLGEEAVRRYVDVSEYIERLATADGIDTKGLVMTNEQLADTDAQQQQQAMMASAIPQAVQAGGQLMTEGMKQYGQSQQQQQQQ